MGTTAFTLSFIATLFLTPLIIRISYKTGLLDYPKRNSIHSKPVPMTGGLIIFVIFFGLNTALGSTHNLIPLFLAAISLLASGLYDDIKGLNAPRKLLIQFISATVLISFGISIRRITIPFGPVLELADFSIPLTMIWIIFIINLVNILDGLDGLASGLCLIIFFVLFTIVGPSSTSIQLLIIMGAILAFLIFNFYPAKIFLGNNGSSLLGLAIAYFSLITSQKSTVLPILAIPLGILTVQIFDMAYSVIRRVGKGTPVFQGDKGHIHHLLLKLTRDQKKAVLVLYLISILLAALTLRIIVFW